MLSADAVLDEEALRGILKAGHSRVPVHRPGTRWVPSRGIMCPSKQRAPCTFHLEIATLRRAPCFLQRHAHHVLLTHGAARGLPFAFMRMQWLERMFAVEWWHVTMSN